MRWYINDMSLQGQFNDVPLFLTFLEGLLASRGRFECLRTEMRLTRSIADRQVSAGQTLRQILSSTNRKELRRAVLLWLDRNGPFIEADRQHENDDYVECKALDVTDTGLGEATRRVKANTMALAFSFPGGPIEFGETPLHVEHGLPDDRLGHYAIHNLWTLADLTSSALEARPAPSSWQQLVEAARERYPRLHIPDAVYTNASLAKEPFEAPICDRALALLKCLDDYMAGRIEGGAEGPAALAVIETFFTGDRALFSGESPTNQVAFKAEMTFPDPDVAGNRIFAHWHGKISHRFFRLHFEWPVSADTQRLKVLYLGPKLTKQ
jgi:hypothetical protein